MNQNNQNGSVFFYILLAIALIAGLTYAVSRGNRGSAGMLTDEQARVAAQEIIDYGNTVAAAVQKLRLRGCKDTEISFENNISSANYTNPNAPSDKSCHVFDINGGNINVKIPQDSWIVPKPSVNHKAYQTPYISSRHCVDGVGESGCLEPELTFMFSYLKKNICEQINANLGILNELNDTNLFTLRNANHATGTFILEAQDKIDNDIDVTGKNQFCITTNGINANHTPNPGYTYVNVLIAR